MTVAQRAHVGRRDLIRIFGEDRLVAVIRTPSAALARESARAISEAGVRLIEITMTVPDALEVIEELATDASFSARGAIVGAGTVLNGRQADAALLAGARFLVSRSEEHTSELQSQFHLVCRLLLEKKKAIRWNHILLLTYN